MDGLREWLRQNQSIVTVVVVVLLVAALGIAMMNMRQGGGKKTAYFYDLNKKELFVDSVDKRPPFEVGSGAAPDGGPAGVAAAVFACGDGCADESKRFVGYVTKYTDQAVKWLEEADAMGTDPSTQGKRSELWMKAEISQVYMLPDGTKWLSMQDPSYEKAMAGYRARCTGDDKLTTCAP
ncbi:MAG: hypothetical protein IT443_05535 [Phycisphaeraceae bacterium]|nr:hypothetical protein [Phycisphaeraceae bacterium]